jgi:hypothetical protein
MLTKLLLNAFRATRNIVIIYSKCGTSRLEDKNTKRSVPDPNPDPDPPDPHVFGPPRSGSISQLTGFGSFYQTKKVRKTLIPTVL